MEGATPLDDLAAKLADVDLPEGMSLITGPTAQVKPPALLIQPDNPWIVPSAMCNDEQRYLAIAVVTASSPAAGVRKLYAALKAVKNELVVNEAWSWESISAPRLNEDSTSPLMAASIRLKYMSSEEEEILS